MTLLHRYRNPLRSGHHTHCLPPFVFSLLLGAAALLFSCTAPERHTEVDGEGMLLLPHVPDTLTTPAARAAYLLAHFWDAMVFSDTAYVEDELFMETTFVNFLSLFPHATDEAQRRGVQQLLEQARGEERAVTRLMETAEKYLGDPNSPMRDEGHYRLFLEESLEGGVLTETEQEHYCDCLERVKKNAPGSVATDFAFRTRGGQRSTLHEVEAERLLLVFYDPACDHCSAILNDLWAMPRVRNAVAAGRLTILAVYTEGDTPLWERTAADLPTEWTVAIDESDIVATNRYDIPAMPTLYLLDPAKQVLLKDPKL